MIGKGGGGADLNAPFAWWNIIVTGVRKTH
jgi:hypothetical protein